ncbi:MAG: class I SAM-dependent methyltransferase [Candidatus Acidiferrales bacterium]
MDNKAHWEKIYTSKPIKEVSWYRDRLSTSLELIGRAGLPAKAKIIDVGGGASTLVDDLLRMGFGNVTVLDVSAAAMENSIQRLDAQAGPVQSGSVHWIEGDITDTQLGDSRYDLWHDRAVFHFLVDPAKRAAYVANATRAIKEGGFLIAATFAPTGPAKCSGLPVERYGPEELARQFPEFILLDNRSEQHRTPSGATQDFTYVLLQKRVRSGGANPLVDKPSRKTI